VTYSSAGLSAQWVAIADVNRDGRPDLVVANQGSSDSFTSGSVAVLLGNGDGTFQTAMTYASGGNVARTVVVSDVNGDGFADLLVDNVCASSTLRPAKLRLCWSSLGERRRNFSDRSVLWLRGSRCNLGSCDGFE
jgi:hypothetical protein